MTISQTQQNWFADAGCLGYIVLRIACKPEQFERIPGRGPGVNTPHRCEPSLTS
jgi:hypothetical protein